jgi:alpha-mannosidase
LARSLVVALARSGVTATCSSALRARYGDLTVDSNLPDTCVAVGSPDENAFTVAVLAAGDRVYADDVQRQFAEGGSARV